MISKTFFGFALFLSLSSKAQTVSHTVLGSDGGYASGTGGSVAWTIGEPVSGTYASGNITTVGFQQTDIVDLPTLIREQGEDALVLVYPNPVKDQLKVDLSTLQEGAYTLELVDAIGRVVCSTKTHVSQNGSTISLNVNEYAAGNYFLNIKTSGFEKSVKITKTN